MTKEIFQKMAKLEERLNWTVHPTDPVLPPYGELTKVSGVIERIHVEKQGNYFSPQNYRVAKGEVSRNSLFNQIAAVLSFFNGQFGMLASAGKNKEINPETTGYFINIQINNVVYRGWAGACPFEPGDEVELAVEWQEDHYELYAIARPKDKMISVCPNCYCGTTSSLQIFFKTVFKFLFVINIIMVISQYRIDKIFNIFSSFYMLPICFDLMILFTACMMLFIVDRNTNLMTNTYLAEQIFKTFSLTNPKKINLQQITKKRLKQIYKQTGIKPTKEDYEKKPIKYPFWWMLLNCYLYYYE